ncbi:putative CCR4-associated factor 1 homolog 8 [Musa acuminata AAA Group]|uniref:putative CCR4-associated factor 1 homolog 8 n=1 Tax=Musa acuminata AAA Group TaxID=214697 RepID=UPI0031D05BCD
MAVTVVTENIAAQLDLLVDLRRSFRYAAIDTEFPGFIRPTPPYASEEDRYADVKYNVDNMKLIQLGITLFDENGSTPWQGCCWQFNFSDFDPLVHPSSPKSLELLRRSGHDLEGNRRNGINGDKRSNVLRNKLFDRRYGSVYVTFHGLYDVAYVIKLITGGAPLPPTLREFIAAARRVFGALYDIKYIAKYCDGLSGREFGLTRLAQELVVEQDGNPHQAAYDSLSISRVFNEMNRRYNIGGNERFVSVLYGLENSCTESKKRYQRGTMVYHPDYVGQYGFQAHSGIPPLPPTPMFVFLPQVGPPLHQAYGAPSSPESQQQQSTLSCHGYVSGMGNVKVRR